MEKETSQDARRTRKNPPSEGKLARLRYRRRHLRRHHPPMYHHPRKSCHCIEQDIVTAPDQNGGKSAV